VIYAYGALLTFSAFCAGMTVLGAWAAHELRKRFEEYAL
jgi:hypothetical protein